MVQRFSDGHDAFTDTGHQRRSFHKTHSSFHKESTFATTYPLWENSPP